MPVMGPLPGRENECVRAGATTDCASACTAGRAPVARAGRAAHSESAADPTGAPAVGRAAHGHLACNALQTDLGPWVSDQQATARFSVQSCIASGMLSAHLPAQGTSKRMRGMGL